MVVIAIENLTKRYGRRVGVADLSLEVPDGSIFGFLGPNGSGKTTTIRVLLGLLRPTAGTARIFGMNCVREGHRIKAEVGYLPGDLRLYSWMTTELALRLISRIRGRELFQEGRRLIDVFGLDPAVRVRNMSRGMRQKLGLILALAHRPQLLILDEPTASLDPLMQAKLYRELRTLALQGHSVFLSSHSLSEVQELCAHVAILREGRLVAHESIENLRGRARRTVTIRWSGTAPGDGIPPPPFLTVVDRVPGEWRAVLTGKAMDLISWSATQPIEDLAIEEPDLSTLFQDYYQ
jgi:ABC-2 type transport system ATP-binding protein